MLVLEGLEHGDVDTIEEAELDSNLGRKALRQQLHANQLGSMIQYIHTPIYHFFCRFRCRDEKHAGS